MKKSVLFTLLLSNFILLSCEEKEGLFEDLSADDQQSIEIMADLYDIARRYQDSLKLCTEQPDLCHLHTDDLDSLFHSAMEQYDMQHELYSHSNVVDDHLHRDDLLDEHGNEPEDHEEEQLEPDHGEDEHSDEPEAENHGEEEAEPHGEEDSDTSHDDEESHDDGFWSNGHNISNQLMIKELLEEHEEFHENHE